MNYERIYNEIVEMLKTKIEKRNKEFIMKSIILFQNVLVERIEK